MGVSSCVCACDSACAALARKASTAGKHVCVMRQDTWLAHVAVLCICTITITPQQHRLRDATARPKCALCCVVSSALQLLRMILNNQVTVALGSAAGYQEGNPGPCTTCAQLTSPTGLFFDGNRLIFADRGNDRVRAITMIENLGTGTTSSLVGRGSTFRDGPLANATFSDPQGIAVGRNGDIFVSGKFLNHLFSNVMVLQAWELRDCS